MKTDAMFEIHLNCWGTRMRTISKLDLWLRPPSLANGGVDLVMPARHVWAYGYAAPQSGNESRYRCQQWWHPTPEVVVPRYETVNPQGWPRMGVSPRAIHNLGLDPPYSVLGSLNMGWFSIIATREHLVSFLKFQCDGCLHSLKRQTWAVWCLWILYNFDWFRWSGKREVGRLQSISASHQSQSQSLPSPFSVSTWLISSNSNKKWHVACGFVCNMI